ncbi:MAG: HYR domain-containing protein [Bacteroidetes bacterium]|nr:HYR domain-containing protein [Bacteroidota bacterium]
MKNLLLVYLICLSSAVLAQIPTDAIAHWPMDGNAVDQSNNKNDGAMIGGVQTAADRFGNACGALKFDGSTGYLSVPSSVSLKSPVSAYTVAVWVKMEQNPTSPTRKWLTVCCKSDIQMETVNSPQFRVQSMQDDARGYNTVSMNTDFTEPANENLLLGQWFFYVVRYDGVQVNAYIDGKAAFSFAYAKPFTPNDMPLEIGRDVPGGMEFYCGIMDDLRIFDRALSLSEITALYQDKSAKGKTAAVAIECPADITKTAIVGKCGIPVNYLEPTATVDCGTANVQLVAGLASESFFPIGETTVTYRATAAKGSSAECSFKVTVQDNSVPTIQCPASMVVNCDPGACDAVVQYADPTGKGACGDPTLERILGEESGFAFPKGISKQTYRVTDASGKTAECSFTITVKDTEKPTITCPQDLQVEADAGTTGAIVNYDAPEYGDNCPGSILSKLKGPQSGARFPVGASTLTYQVKDAAGLTATCSFVVTVAVTDELGIVCPENKVVSTDPGDCAAIVNFKAATLTGNLKDATVTQTGGLKSGEQFAVGTEEILFTASHPSGKSADCSFAITVKDMEKPKITCPDDMQVQSKAEGTSVSFEPPRYSDNCAGSKLSKLKGLQNGANFPVGATTMTYQVVDAAGNSATCSFTVTVEAAKEEGNLGIRCPSDKVVPADPGDCSVAVGFSAATVTGNLSDAIVAQTGGARSGSRLGIGSHVITYTASHSSGKSAECSFKIKVQDMEEPRITCPNDVHVQAKFQADGANYAFEQPDFADNCPGSKLTQVAGPESGEFFPIGASTLTFEVRDAAGLTANCSFNVHVTAKEPELPTRLGGDSIVFQKDMIKVQSRQVRIYFYDNHDQDGDTVSLNFDGDWLVDHEKILGKKKVLENNHFIDLDISPNKVHYLISKAWNEGRKPTNTLTIEIHDGVSPPKILDLTSNIGKSSAIKLFYKK